MILFANSLMLKHPLLEPWADRKTISPCLSSTKISAKVKKTEVNKGFIEMSRQENQPKVHKFPPQLRLVWNADEEISPSPEMLEAAQQQQVDDAMARHDEDIVALKKAGADENILDANGDFGLTWFSRTVNWKRHGDITSRDEVGEMVAPDGWKSRV